METEETLPFPPPLARQTSRERAAFMTKRSNTPSLEQLTEARLAELRNEHFLWETPAPRSDQMVPAAEKTDKQIVLASRRTDQQIVLASHRTERASSAPLRWRGMPVSEELQLYALRVERGEELAPYRGPILADPSLELPWDAADARALRKGTRRSVWVLLALAALGALAAFVVPNLEPSLPERTQLAPLQEERPLSATAVAAAAAPVAAAAIESGPLLSEPLPALREPPPAPPQVPATPPRRASLRTVAAGATPRSAAAPSAASSASPGAAAPRRQTDAQHPLPARSPDATGPSMLLVDRPSF
jgi:hypothetical protein